MQLVYGAILLEGGEGVIAKDPSALYEHKRSSNWLKVKENYDVEMVVRGLVAGSSNGKRADTFGAFECWSSDGLIKVDVGSGISDDMLKRYTEDEDPIGMIVKVRFNRLICDKNGGQVTMFLPRIREERLDKTTANSAKEIIQEIVSNKGLVEADVLERLNLTQWYKDIKR
jgi:hypothetical protein